MSIYQTNKNNVGASNPVGQVVITDFLSTPLLEMEHVCTRMIK